MNSASWQSWHFIWKWTKILFGPLRKECKNAYGSPILKRGFLLRKQCGGLWLNQWCNLILKALFWMCVVIVWSHLAQIWNGSTIFRKHHTATKFFVISVQKSNNNDSVAFFIFELLIGHDDRTMSTRDAYQWALFKQKRAMPKLIVKGKASPFFQLISLKGQWTFSKSLLLFHTVSFLVCWPAKKLWASFL